MLTEYVVFFWSPAVYTIHTLRRIAFLVASHIHWTTDCRITHFSFPDALFFITVPLWGLRSEVLLCHFKESVVRVLWVHHICEFESKMETFYWFFSCINIIFSSYCSYLLTARETCDCTDSCNRGSFGCLITHASLSHTHTHYVQYKNANFSVFWFEDRPCHLAVSTCLSSRYCSWNTTKNQKRPYFQVCAAGKVKDQYSCNCIFDTI